MTKPKWGDAMNYQLEAKFWDAKAAAADAQVRKVNEPLAMDSWLMIADTCRQLAAQFRDMDRRDKAGTRQSRERSIMR